MGLKMRIDAIKIGKNPPDDVNVIVEVPVGGHPIKYEMDKEAGALIVDRFLYTPMTYPGNYGFVPHTLSEDGDPIDVLICNTRPLVPGCVINVRPIGVMVMEDDGGKDEKIIAVPSHKLTQRYDKIENYTDMPEITLKQIEHFFEHYKDLEPGKWVKIAGWQDVSVAKKLIVEAIDVYPLCQILRVAIDPEDFLSGGVAGDDGYGRFGNAERLGQQRDKRLVGLALFRNAGDTRLQMRLAFGIQFDAIDRVTAAVRGQPNGQPQVIGKGLVRRNHKNRGTMLFHIRERMKKMISSTTIGEMSMPPRSGRMRRMGRSTGSVTL